MEPINYTGQLLQPDFAGAYGQGVLGGQEIQARRTALEQQQAEAAAAAQLRAQYSTDIHEYLANPTARGAAALTAKYPGQKDAFLKSWETFNNEQKDSEFQSGAQVWKAVSTGNVDVANQLLDERIKATENSGKDASKLKAVKDGIAKDPKLGSGLLAMYLSGVDPERWKKVVDAETVVGTEARAAEKAPAELTEAQAKAKSASVAAQFAESNAAADLAKKGWDITKVQEDIKIARQNVAIAAANSAISREANTIRREELTAKRDELIQKRDEAVRGKEYEANSAMTSLDSAITLADDILGDEDTLRAAVGTSGWRGFIPGTKARAMAGKLERLQNVLAAENLDKMKGAMSDKDIVFLKNIQSNLDRYQDEESFLKEMRRVRQVLNDNKPKLAAKFGMPAAAPSAPAAPAKTNTGASVSNW